MIAFSTIFQYNKTIIQQRRKTAMNILVLEDEPALLATITALIRESGHIAMPFSSAEDLLAYADTHARWVDAAVLDIILKRQVLSGIDTARKLRNGGFEGPIVFLSSSKEYGPESYEVNAAGYLEKPVSSEKISLLLQIVSGIIGRRKSGSEPSLLITIGKLAQKLLFCDILYVEATGNTLNFHMTDGSVFSVRAPLKAYAPLLLADERFAESHRSYIVNLDYVVAIKGSDVMMVDGSKLLVAKTHTAFKEKFIRWQLSGGV
jgi:DNA-binding LytR/AlgR family response regulator